MDEQTNHDLVTLVDGVIVACLKNQLPPVPIALASAFAQTLAQDESEYAEIFGELLLLIRERLEFLQATIQAPN
jgi:hypothetical protein